MKKTAIYGGSFDPPHKGHSEIIMRLLQEFDRVVVVPGFVSPFKQNAKQASAAERLNMLHLALNDTAFAEAAAKNKIEISTYEIDKGGVSYTFDTINHFAAAEPQSKLFFVTGSEGVPTLHLWKNAHLLKKMVTFYVVPRQNYPICLRPDFDMQAARFEVEDYSSSLFKAAHAFGYSGQMVSAKVYDYIVNSDLYSDYKYLTGGFKVFGLSDSRVLHTYRAVKAGIMLSKIHGESVDKTITALILHDIGKNITPTIAQNIGITLSPADDMPKACRHAVWGAEIARQYYKIEDEDILNSIRFHTTCRPDMSRLEKIVALADYIEEGREFAQREAVLMAAKNNLDMAVSDMLQGVLENLRQTKREICDISQKALFFYKNLIYTNK